MNEQRYIGCIVGLAVGDALGFPAEFRSRAQILREVGPDGITGFIAQKDPRFTRPMIIGRDHPPGTYTDDTQMSLAVADALISAGDRDLDTLMRVMAQKFVAWSESDDNDRAPGATCMAGCRNLRRGVPWREAGVRDSKGCGSAMRVAPIGLYYARDLDRLEEVARASSLLTHGHDAALEGAIAAALMVALAVQGKTPREMYGELERRCFARSSDFAACLSKVPAALELPPEEALTARVLGEAWIAEEAVASALYCVWRAPDDYRAAVLSAVNTDGDSDSIAAITGSVLGARLGFDAIPSAWRDAIEAGEHLRDVGAKLWANAR